jgi:hypothetical protein
MFNMAPWLPSLELAHRGECPLPVKSAGTLRREWRPSVRYSLESATCFHIARTLPFVPLCIFSVLYGLQSFFNSHSISYLTGIVVLSREVNRSGREADHPHLASRLRMIGAIPLLPLRAFTASTNTAVRVPRYIPLADWTVLLWAVGEVCLKF